MFVLQTLNPNILRVLKLRKNRTKNKWNAKIECLYYKSLLVLYIDTNSYVFYFSENGGNVK